MKTRDHADLCCTTLWRSREGSWAGGDARTGHSRRRVAETKSMPNDVVLLSGLQDVALKMEMRPQVRGPQGQPSNRSLPGSPQRHYQKKRIRARRRLRKHGQRWRTDLLFEWVPVFGSAFRPMGSVQGQSFAWSFGQWVGWFDHCVVRRWSRSTSDLWPTPAN